MNADTRPPRPPMWKYAKKYCKSNVFLYISVNTKVSISSYMISLFDNHEGSKSLYLVGTKQVSFRFTKTWRLKEKQIPRLKKSFKANPGAIVCLSVCLSVCVRTKCILRSPSGALFLLFIPLVPHFSRHFLHNKMEMAYSFFSTRTTLDSYSPSTKNTDLCIELFLLALVLILY